MVAFSSRCRRAIASGDLADSTASQGAANINLERLGASFTVTMIRWDLPWEDMYLQLTPRWGSSAVAQIGWSALIVVVCAGLLLWLYRYEMRLVRGLTALW